MKSNVPSKRRVLMIACNQVLRVLAAGAVLALAGPLGAQCGVERRAIKSGFDPAAASIDTNATTPTTIAALTSLPAPNPIPPTARVGPAETTTWVVRATLTAYKLEGGPTGDHDYHLVINDDAGNHMIAEIPSPSCVSAQSSAFVDAITAARKAFDETFTVNSTFQTANVPVEVTGVGMFDFSHGQRGLAPNGIELHPVLKIAFNPGTGTPPTPPSPPPPPTVTTPTAGSPGVLGNGGFEQGASNPAPWHASAGVIDDERSEPARTGEWKAWLGGTGHTHTDRLYQDVEVPDASKVTLTFFLHVVTDESGDHAHDTLAAQIRDHANHVKGTIATFSNLDANATFEEQDIDLTPYKGTSIRLYFLGSEDAANQTSFVIDDVRVKAE